MSCGRLARLRGITLKWRNGRRAAFRAQCPLRAWEFVSPSAPQLSPMAVLRWLALADCTMILAESHRDYLTMMAADHRIAMLNIVGDSLTLDY